MELQTACILLLSLHIGYTSAQPYQVPDPFLQARNGRGFRAYLPDACGIENFEFQALTNKSGEDEWTGGNVTKPQNGHWTFEAPDLSLAPGDRLKYRANVKHLGRQYRHPDTEWVVPEELEDEFNPPPFDKRQQCKEKRQPPNDSREEPFPKPGFKSPCPWADVPRPGDTREIVLEKQLIGLQCEMNAHMDRSARIQYQLTQELTDLKKLNYAAVARMQRLESLIRNLPGRTPSPAYPTPAYPFI